MTWVATAIVGSAVIGGVSADRAASKPAKAAKKGIREQRRQFDLTREDFAPWREQGSAAVERLGRASTGDMSDFYASPSYEFVRSEGQRDMGNSFAARGSSLSGNALRALAEFNQNIASTEYGNWWNRQAGLAGVGQAATGATAAFGANAANNISNAYSNIGDARASGIQGIGGAINSGIGNYLYYRGLNDGAPITEIAPSSYAPTPRTYFPGG